MLKIFKDMMQKDKRDPEKTTLLKEKHDRKRKHYSGTRSKSGRQTVSSSSDHHKDEPYKMSKHETRNAAYDGCTSQRTLPFQGEKRESWWFWGDTEAKPKEEEETCSCVSCALKKLFNTDYACIACVTILLVLSVIIAIMLVYKSMPCTPSNGHPINAAKTSNKKAENERLKRKIESLGKWSFGPKKQWRNIFRRDSDSDFSSFSFGQGSDMSSLVDTDNDLSKILDSDKLTDIQHSDRLRDFYKKLIQTDAAIRSLRKTLTDNAYTSTNNFDLNSNYDITNNFDINNNYDINSNMDFNSKINLDNKLDTDRLKRSVNFNPGRLFHFKTRAPATQSKIKNGKLITKSTINMTSNKKSNDKDNKASRNKRFGNFTHEGFIIEKNKVMIQYKPSRVVAKCSHSPIDSKSHENQLTHPFYKNTQRLDELLDQFIDKKLPDLLADRLELGMLFDKNKKYKHPGNEEIIIVKDDDILKDYDQNQRNEDNKKEGNGKDYPNQRNYNQNNNARVGASKIIDKEEQTTVKAFVIAKDAPKIVSKNDVKHTVKVFENDFFEDSDGVEKKSERSSTGGYDILLSISTLANPVAKRTTNKPTTAFADRPNLRKLLQVNMKAEDGIAYEDLKEVLADYKEGHDDEDKETDRKKRNDGDQYDSQLKVGEVKRLPIGVHNPNWKGPMPLYPDELNQMTIKGQPDNKIDIPVHSQDSVPEKDYLELVKTDVEYVESYLDNGYERLVELAQAYSDYGVLNEKKDTNAEKKATEKENKVGNRKSGISMKKLRNSFKRGLKKKQFFQKPKQGGDLSEGIRIEILPNPKKGEFHPSADEIGPTFKEMLSKHVKILDPTHTEPTHFTTHVPDLTTHMQTNNLNLPKAKGIKGFDPNNVIFKKRTLKATDLVNINSATEIDKEFGVIATTNKFQFDKDAAKELNKKTTDTDKSSDNSKDYHADKRRTGDLESIKVEVDKKIVNKNQRTDFLKTSRSKSEAKFNDSIQGKTTKSNTKEGESSLSNFFMNLSKWFSAMDKMEVEEAKKPAKVIPSVKNAKITKHIDEYETSKSQIALPAYDSDIVENIGHRSRVLLSVEVTNNTEKAEDQGKSEEEGNQVTVVLSSTEPMNNANSTRSVRETTESMKNYDTASNDTNNRVVKRQAIDDSNLIFWNDLYDEDYGINADPIDNNIRNKHSAEKSDLLKKSNTWLQDKVKKIADKFYSNDAKKTAKEKVAKNEPKQVKRNVKYVGDYEDDSTSKIDLKALTERMKAVCKETVKAVQETKHIQVRDDNKEGQAAATLMQQLIRLMTDLVDFQVQERTCRRLPPDLQSFLEWLTSSKQDDADSDTFYRDKNADRFGIDFANKLDKSTGQDLLQPSERENTDSKTDCLGTLHAVQNLIREYEEMTEDDKSVMTGVKNYLENQMHFLQRQLFSFDDKYLSQGGRFRRDAITDLGHTVAGSLDHTAQRLDNQYKNLKKLYKKYKYKVEPAYEEVARTTAGINKAVTKMAHKILNVPNPKQGKFQQKKILKPQNVLKINDKSKEQMNRNKNQKVTKQKHRSLNNFYFRNKANSKGKNSFNDYGIHKDNSFRVDTGQEFSDKDERNIQDVYFKAVEDAKKSSASKGAHKRDSDTFDKTDIFRINDYEGEKDN